MVNHLFFSKSKKPFYSGYLKKYFFFSWALLSLPLMVQATVIHTRNGQVDIAQTPKTIAVYGYGMLDTVDALGVKITAGPKERFNTYLNKIPIEKNMGSSHAADLEGLYRLKPDLIIIGNRVSRQYPELKKIAPTLDLSIGIKGGASIYQEGIMRLRELANLFNRQERARELEEALNKQRDATLKATQNMGKGMIVLIIGKQLSLLGEQSVAGWIIRELKLKTVNDHYEFKKITDIRPISFEYILAQKPEWIIVLDRNQAIGQERNIKSQKLLDNPLIAATKAAQKQQIYYLNNQDALIPIGGVRAMKRVLQEIEQKIKQKN